MQSNNADNKSKKYIKPGVEQRLRQRGIELRRMYNETPVSSQRGASSVNLGLLSREQSIIWKRQTSGTKVRNLSNYVSSQADITRNSSIDSERKRKGQRKNQWVTSTNGSKTRGDLASQGVNQRMGFFSRQEGTVQQVDHGLMRGDDQDGKTRSPDEHPLGQ